MIVMLKFKIIILFITILLTGCVPNFQNSISPSISTLDNLVVNENQNIEWSKFNKQEYNFSFDYPKSWEIYSAGNIIQLYSKNGFLGEAVIQEGEMYMEFYVLSANGRDFSSMNQTNKEWCQTDLILPSDYEAKRKSNLHIVEKGYENINGNKIFTLYYIPDYDVNSSSGRWHTKNICFIENDQIVFVLAQPINEKYRPIYNNILSSFRFKDPIKN